MVEDKKDSKDVSRDTKKFFDDGRLVVTNYEIIQKKYDGSRKIYIENVAGVTFVNSSMQRNMAALMFVIGIIIAILLRIGKYNQLFLIAPIFIGILSIILFVTSTDKALIQSSASIFNITHSLGFKESYSTVEKAIDDAKKYSRKNN